MNKSIDPSNLIKVGGPLSQCINGFEPRPQQQAMLEGVQKAYEDNAIALIEAGTGVGKSLAYLIPAILHAAKTGERTVISTHTITLQEQLVYKDIPMVLKALGLEIKAELVKGMGNYLCLRKYEEALAESPLLPPEEAQELTRMEGWQGTTQQGSLSELPFVLSPANRERTAAESDTCQRGMCPHFQKCFFYKARQKAQDAQILVVNHHLLFSDLSLRAQSEGAEEVGILPAYQRVVIDEAHHIDDIATKYFAIRVSHWEVIRLMTRLSADRNGRLSALRTRLVDVFLQQKKSPPPLFREIHNMIELELPGIRRELVQQFSDLFDDFSHFIHEYKQSSRDDTTSHQHFILRLLPDVLKHPDWHGQLMPRAKQTIATAQKYCTSIESMLKQLMELNHRKFEEQTSAIRQDIKALTGRLQHMALTLEAIINGESRLDRVRWMETYPMRGIQNVTLMDAALDVSDQLVDWLFKKFQTVILCSATLTTNRNFSFFRQQMGLDTDLLDGKEVREYLFDSPFNYQEQALLAVPTDLPAPTHPDFLAAAIEQIWASVVASRGQALVLFTSYQMLRQCHSALQQRFADRHYPLLRQGEENRQALLHKLRTMNHAVLFATYSFWEGVDIAGDALRCVIIVKLPFKVPTEPILEGRAEALSAAGRNPFTELSLPLAAVTFKQGCGRLIRNGSDRGCVVCLDSRLITKAYGTQFLHSIPEYQRVVDNSSEVVKKMGEFYYKTQYLVRRQQQQSVAAQPVT